MTIDNVLEILEKHKLHIPSNVFYELKADIVNFEEPTTKNDLALIHTEGLDEGIRCAMCINSIKSDRGCDGNCVVNNAMYKEVMDVIENHIVDTDKMIEPTTKNDLGVDCIKKSDAINIIQDMHGLARADVISDAVNRIITMPSVTPQEPRKGHWITRPHIYGVAFCSECGFELKINNTNYCPNCGADMRSKAESEE